eukprot:1159597-Pelagomonas_calceolata.AAC.19
MVVASDASFNLNDTDARICAYPPSSSYCPGKSSAQGPVVGRRHAGQMCTCAGMQTKAACTALVAGCAATESNRVWMRYEPASDGAECSQAKITWLPPPQITHTTYIPTQTHAYVQEMTAPIAELAPEYAVGTIILDLLASQIVKMVPFIVQPQHKLQLSNIFTAYAVIKQVSQYLQHSFKI